MTVILTSLHAMDQSRTLGPIPFTCTLRCYVDIMYESNLYDMTHITVFFKDIAGNLGTGNHGGKFGEHITVDLTKVLESYLRTEHDLDLGMIHGYFTTDEPFNAQL